MVAVKRLGLRGLRGGKGFWLREAELGKCCRYRTRGAVNMVAPYYHVGGAIAELKARFSADRRAQPASRARVFSWTTDETFERSQIGKIDAYSETTGQNG